MDDGLAGPRAPDLLIQAARIVPVDGPVPSLAGSPVDLRVSRGRVTQIAPALPVRPGDRMLRADGRWLIPGLWDQHVHLALWAPTLTWMDLSGARSAQQAVALVAEELAGMRQDGLVRIGFGHRSGQWSPAPTVAQLDAVTGARPVVLISGDAHNGWLNSAVLRCLKLPLTDEVLSETDWFAVFPRLHELPGYPTVSDELYQKAIEHAAAKGVVGVVDMEFDRGYRDWPDRARRGVGGIRVRVATYPEGLDEVLESGLRTGDRLEARGLITIGPLKIISDGSLNTRTAYCYTPYTDIDDGARGAMNLPAAELVRLMGRAGTGGLQVAVHAIGDAAVARVLDAFEQTGAVGSVEHVQLVARPDLHRMARAGVRASVQPAHLLDDRDVTEQAWSDRTGRCFAFRDMVAAGVELRLGSDAPVAPLDPWLAMSAAVARSDQGQEPWHPQQSLTAQQALAASTDGQPTVRVGARGDLVLLDADPLQQGPSSQVAARLRDMRVAATVLAGEPVFFDGAVFFDG